MRSARRFRVGAALATARPRVLAFLVDWLFWGYVSYCVMYLLNAYWFTMYVNFYGILS